MIFNFETKFSMSNKEDVFKKLMLHYLKQTFYITKSFGLKWQNNWWY